MHRDEHCTRKGLKVLGMMKPPRLTSISEISVPRRRRISRSSFLLMVPVLSKSNACTKREASHEEVAGMGTALKLSSDDDHFARMFRGGSTLIRPKGKEKVRDKQHSHAHLGSHTVLIGW